MRSVIALHHRELSTTEAHSHVISHNLSDGATIINREPCREVKCSLSSYLCCKIPLYIKREVTLVISRDVSLIVVIQLTKRDDSVYPGTDHPFRKSLEKETVNYLCCYNETNDNKSQIIGLSSCIRKSNGWRKLNVIRNRLIHFGVNISSNAIIYIRTKLIVTDELQPLKESLKETKATWNLIYILTKRKMYIRWSFPIQIEKPKFQNP
ncbi:hypothetical protein YC2023_005192 [Brassica napus]